MSNNIKYSIEQVEGNIVARSTVNSFNLDHVTDKDITSFYKQISSQALIDTGLLPLNGTGILAIRAAGNHIQIAFQHAPQMSYVNWGANEGDRNAVSYYVAQPYRIWIADLIDGNLYGARMFYSPYPITTPDAPLYHINLPNTNCEGYRGNGVGWICLYHNEDWSSYPFNVKIQKLIERCSGIETYNDANMSETDGPRFYAKHNKPDYVINPLLWQKKSEEGVDWTLDPDLWIPVLVQDLDNQSKHYKDGQPLTFAMALLGSYNSYYNDSYVPKLVNTFAREDLEIPTKSVFNIFSTSYNSSSSHQQHYDQFANSIKIKQDIANTVLSKPSLFTSEEAAVLKEDDDNSFMCEYCQEYFSFDENESYTINDSVVCEPCVQEYCVWCDNTEQWLHQEDENAHYDEKNGCWIDLSQCTTGECPSCTEFLWSTGNNLPTYTVHLDGQDHSFCSNCFDDYLDEHFPDLDTNTTHSTNCHVCGAWIPKDIPGFYQFPSVQELEINHSFDWHSLGSDLNLSQFILQDEPFRIIKKYFCPTHASNVEWCPSGSWVNSSSLTTISPWISGPVPLKKDPSQFIVAKITALSLTKTNNKYLYDADSQPHPFSGPISIAGMYSLSYILFLATLSRGMILENSPYMNLYTLNGDNFSFNKINDEELF